METISIVQEEKHLEKKLDTNVLRENYKELISNKMLLLKSKQRFTREKYMYLVNKLKILQQSMWSNDKIIKSTDLIERYTYRTTKNLIF